MALCVSLVSESDTLAAINDQATIYTPTDALHYVQLTEAERRLFHGFKRAFGGSVEWRKQ